MAIADPGGDADAGYLDITRLAARATAGRLELSLVLAAAIPASTVTVGTVRYDFDLDTDGDGVADFVASLENVPEGGYRPALTDSATGRRLEGADYPGKAASNGGEVTLTLDLAAVGCPKTAAIRSSSSRTRGGLTGGDEAPDAGSGTLSLSTGC